MCTAIKRNVCGYKTSAHVPKPHRTMNAGLFRVKKLLFTPTSPPWAWPLLIPKPHVAGAVSKGSFPREYSQISLSRQPPQICCCHPGVNSGVQTSSWESNTSPPCCSGRSQIAQTLGLPAPRWGIQSGIAVTPMPHKMLLFSCQILTPWSIHESASHSPPAFPCSLMKISELCVIQQEAGAIRTHPGSHFSPSSLLHKPQHLVNNICASRQLSHR